MIFCCSLFCLYPNQNFRFILSISLLQISLANCQNITPSFGDFSAHSFVLEFPSNYCHHTIKGHLIIYFTFQLDTQDRPSCFQPLEDIFSLSGLLRCGKSCRLRWKNYLRPDIKRGPFTLEEEKLVIQLHGILGNR